MLEFQYQISHSSEILLLAWFGEPLVTMWIPIDPQSLTTYLKEQ
jgi:hypothetical protein